MIHSPRAHLVATASPCSMWRRDFDMFAKQGCAVYLHRANLKAVSGQSREERSIRPFPRSHPPVGQNYLPPAHTGKVRETPRPFENTRHKSPHRPSSPLTPLSTLLSPLPSVLSSSPVPCRRQLRRLHPRRGRLFLVGRLDLLGRPARSSSAALLEGFIHGGKVALPPLRACLYPRSVDRGRIFGPG